MPPAYPFALTLASASRGRRYLLERAGYTFDVRPADVDEPTAARYGSCRQYVSEVCWLKAAAVAPHIADGIAIAADSVAWLDGTVIGKPDDVRDAERILRRLSGTVHELWTGVCLWRVRDGLQLCFQEVSRLEMKALTEEELAGYLASNRWVGCSGAYTIDELSDPFLKVIEGSLSNVIGLPMESLALALDRMARLE